MDGISPRPGTLFRLGEGSPDGNRPGSRRADLAGGEGTVEIGLGQRRLPRLTPAQVRFLSPAGHDPTALAMPRGQPSSAGAALGTARVAGGFPADQQGNAGRRPT